VPKPHNLMTLTFDLVTFVKVIAPQGHCKRPYGSRTFCLRVLPKNGFLKTIDGSYVPYMMVKSI